MNLFTINRSIFILSPSVHSDCSILPKHIGKLHAFAASAVH